MYHHRTSEPTSHQTYSTERHQAAGSGDRRMRRGRLVAARQEGKGEMGIDPGPAIRAYESAE